MSSTPAAPPSPAGLPAALTRFIGRGREISDLENLLESDRLVTLTGAGGSGKTRLAREVVASGRISWTGVVWIDLAPLTEYGLFLPQLAQAFGLVATAEHSAVDLIRRAVGSQQILLVLDNCEHLVEGIASFAEDCLGAVPTLHILATSREALGVSGETAWLVPPLGEAEAAQLFVDRARSVLPGFALTEATRPAIETICRRLDGIPLAIELAAARVRVITPDQIAERLSDALRLLNVGSRTALPRQRTLRGTLDWSFALLTDFERRLLERLAVFPATFSLESAESVVSDESLAAEDVLDGISTLVDKSLIVLDSSGPEVRYRLLETVRQYGEERLREAGGWEAARQRLATRYLAAAETAAPFVFGGASDPAWMARLTADTPNYRAVAEWAAEQPTRVDIGLRLGWALHWFWFARGSFQEGSRQLRTALAMSESASPEWRARASLALAHVGIWQGWRTGITQLMEKAVAGLEASHDRFNLAYALVGLGAGHIIEGTPAESAPHLDRAELLLSGHPPHVLHSLLQFWRGLAAHHLGDMAGARSAFDKAGVNGRRINHPPAIAYPLAMLGSIDLAEGQPREALRHYGESLTIHGGIDDRWGLVRGLEGVGIAVGMLGNATDAAVLLGAAERLREHYAIPHAGGEVAAYQAAAEQVRNDLGAAACELWDRGQGLELTKAVSLALDLVRLHDETRDAADQPSTLPVAPDLALYTLGNFRAVVRGQEIEQSAWGSARPRELLALLVLQPHGLTREQAGAAMWPEATATQVRNNFHVTMHRLRKALGDANWVSTDQDRYRLDPALTVWCDATWLEESVAAMERPLADPVEATRIADRLASYQGEFLGREPTGPWREAVAQRLRRAFVEGQLALVAWHHRHAAYASATDATRRIIREDPLNEDAWRWLMRCLADHGDVSGALGAYRQFADLLANEIGATPDQATVGLASELAAVRPTATTR